MANNPHYNLLIISKNNCYIKLQCLLKQYDFTCKLATIDLRSTKQLAIQDNQNKRLAKMEQNQKILT
jgi:hypothetical protein